MNFKKQLGKIIVVLAIIIMTVGTLLCIEYDINPFFGLGSGFAFMVIMIYSLPHKILDYGDEEI